MGLTWGRIETAPKDGTEVLVWNGALSLARWCDRGDCGAGWYAIAEGYVVAARDESDWSVIPVPTHWMAIPEPPA